MSFELWCAPFHSRTLTIAEDEFSI